MSMKIITGSTGSKHVTSNNDGEFNQGIFSEKTVLQLGNCFEAQLVDNNTITISDGDLIYQGRHALIEPDTTETITIDTGAIGYNRIDLIVAKYLLDTSTGYESFTLEVIKGTATAGVATAPSYHTGDIRRGATEVDFPLYQVTITGVNITEVKKLFTPRTSSLADEMASTKTAIAGINSNLAVNEYTITTSMWVADSTNEDFGYKATYTTNKYTNNFVPLYVDIIPSDDSAFFSEDELTFKNGGLNYMAQVSTSGFTVWANEIPEVSLKFRVGGEG